MEGQRLVLNDGTIIENGQAGYAGGVLWLWLPGMTMQEAAAIAFNTAQTARIVFQYGEMEDEYIGFTNCRTIMAEENRISVCLARGENNG